MEQLNFATKDLAIELISKHEGKVLTAYKCKADKITIGYGRNLEDKGISDKEARYLLGNDIEEAFYVLSKKMGKSFEFLNSVRKAVLIDMYHNMGTSLFYFKKMIKAINAHDFFTAGEEMKDSKWWRDPNVQFSRKDRLYKMMVSGQYLE